MRFLLVSILWWRSQCCHIFVINYHIASHISIIVHYYYFPFEAPELHTETKINVIYKYFLPYRDFFQMIQFLFFSCFLSKVATTTKSRLQLGKSWRPRRSGYGSDDRERNRLSARDSGSPWGIGKYLRVDSAIRVTAEGNLRFFLYQKGR